MQGTSSCPRPKPSRKASSSSALAFLAARALSQRTRIASTRQYQTESRLLLDRRTRIRWNRAQSPIQTCRLRGVYPAARSVLFSDVKGMLTSTLVPLIGRDSIVIVPFTSLTRSSIVLRPTPLPCLAASTSKPFPGITDFEMQLTVVLPATRHRSGGYAPENVNDAQGSYEYLDGVCQ